MCWPTAQLEVAKRLFDAVHKAQPWHDGTYTIRSEKFSKLTPFRYDDGHRFYLAEWDENPDDDFTTNPAAKPPGLVAQKSPEQQP